MSSLRLCIYIIKTFSLHPGYFVSFHFFVTASPLYFISARHHSFHCNDDRIVTKKKRKKTKTNRKANIWIICLLFFCGLFRLRFVFTLGFSLQFDLWSCD